MMKYLMFFIRHIPDMPKTVFYNLKLFDFRVAVKLPVFFSRHVKVQELRKNSIRIEDCEIKPFMIEFSNSGTKGVTGFRRSFIQVSGAGQIIFKGPAALTGGASLRIGKGTLTLGRNFYANRNFSVICSEQISFGDDVLLGWDICVRDCDGHQFFVDGERTDSVRPVCIGNHVWIGAHVHILKGTRIQNDSVVGYGSIVLSPFSEDHILIGGYPAKKLKSNVSWKE